MPARSANVGPPVPERPDVPSSPDHPSWALVSFLVQDATWCDWIYREFDGERTPKPLLGRSTPFGTAYPERLSVFPDPTDSQELEQYAGVLQTAQFLILVVSPSSGRSSLLQDHFEAFKAAGRQDRVIALIIKGEPASPAAEAGDDADQHWLPDWVRERFQSNKFSESLAGEPLIIDGRLGISSLAEVRARLMAALLQVDRAELRELGIVTRPTAHLAEYPIRAHSAVLPPPTPSTVQFVEIAHQTAVPEKYARWPIWACGLAAIAALGQLALWPTPVEGSGRWGTSVRTKPRRTPVADDRPLVEARPVAQGAELPGRPEAKAKGAAPPERPVSSARPETQLSAPVPSESSPSSPATISAPPPDRTRQEFIARRDRLIRMAEDRMAEGESEEALEILEHATEVAGELAAHATQDPQHVLELALLHRRTGTLAEGLASPARAQTHYDSARRVLLELRATGQLNKQGLLTLADVESSLRQLRNQ